MSDPDTLRTFVQIVDSNGISSAARTLGLAKSAVSRRLAALEARLGARLLERTTRTSHLTDLGREFYDRAQRILHDIDELEALATHGDGPLSGTLRVSLPYSYGEMFLMPFLLEFTARHPDLRTQFDFTDRAVNLIDENYDAAVRIARLPDTAAIARKIAEIRHLLVASPGYLRGAPEIRALDDLKEHPILQHGPAARPRWTLQDASGREQAVRLRAALNTDSGGFLRQAARAGKGIALMPDFLVRDALASGELSRVLGDLSGRPMNVYAIFPQNRLMTRKLRVFIDFMAACCRPA